VKLPRRSQAAGILGSFYKQHILTTASQKSRAHQPIMTCANDNGVVAIQ
jgi:hypothetical protein